MCQLLFWRRKKKEGKERKENEKDMLSLSVETEEETGDQHGVSAVLCLPSLFSKLLGVCQGCLSICLCTGWMGGRALHHLNGCAAAHLSPKHPGTVAKQICCSRL